MSNPDLKKLTSEAFKILRKYDSVPPELYQETFLELAERYHIDLSDVDTAAESRVILQDSVTGLEKREEASKVSIQELKVTAQSANDAIESKDRKALNKTQDDIELLNQKIAKLEASIYHDELTGTKNRRWLFDTFLADEVFRTKGAIGFIDLNNFKTINDTHGHMMGDKVLILVSHLLSQLNKLGREVHTVRFGGDEFLILAPETTLRVLEKELTTIKTHLESKVVNIKEVSFKAGFSFGCLEYEPGQVFYEALEVVDAKMYEAKAKDKTSGS